MKHISYFSRTIFALGLLLLLFSFGYITLEIHLVCFVMYIGLILTLLGSLMCKVYEEDNYEQPED